MAGSKDTTKVRVLAIYLMLQSGRRITTREILRHLDLRYDIQVDRKTIYSDIYAINQIMPIDVRCGGTGGGYQKYDVLRMVEDG